jgi:hypothetical protein
MGNLRVSNEVILAKIESVYNTDPVPTAGANAVLVQSVVPKVSGLRMVQRPVIKANLNNVQAVYGGQLTELSFDCEIKGSGAAGTAPEIGVLFRGCGLHETVVGATSVTYTPLSSAHESITLYWYEGGKKLHKITGARGDYTIKVSAGGIMLVSFKFTGHYSAPTDVSIPTPTYLTTVPRAALAMTITVGAVAVVARDWSVAAGQTIAMPPSIQAPDGYSEIQITDQNFSGTMTIESELAAVIDVDTELQNGTAVTFSPGTLGSVAGNKFALTSATNGLYWTSRDWTDAEGLRLRTMPFGLVDSAAGNDALSMAFT